MKIYLHVLSFVNILEWKDFIEHNRRVFQVVRLTNAEMAQNDIFANFTHLTANICTN